jgi:hypothetical protein
MARLGGRAVRRWLPLFLKGPPRVADPGQRVELRLEDGSPRKTNTGRPEGRTGAP